MPAGSRYVYSGGFATYPQQQLPIAYYSKEANKTFFCYGGVAKGKQSLLHMVSYYDHATGMVPRPTILLDKRTADAHDNPVLTLDKHGYVWIFSNAHGTSRSAYISRSRRPYRVDEFERVVTTNFSYGQPWYLPGQGFLFLHTRYQGSHRILYWMTSADGIQWSEPHELAHAAYGHYQVSNRRGGRVATMFNYHPSKPPYSLARTNLYYMETRDMGRTWLGVDGKALSIPLHEVHNPALVHDYESEGLLVFLKDLQFDAQGRPVLLYLTSKKIIPAAENGPFAWHTARWTGREWQIRDFTTSDNCFDFGSLYIEADGTWRIIAPTAPGPDPYWTGGDVVMWTSRNRGDSWEKVRQLTHDTRFHHTYARRPVNAHPDFYALWADGDAKQPSESRLYFTNQKGTHVWRLPVEMTKDFQRPEVID
ncbi:MAG: BNR-4 repeat-containing protein [Bryobacteraceae bacterium]